MSQDKKITVRITSEDVQKIETLKLEYDVNISALVRRCIRTEYDKKVKENV